MNWLLKNVIKIIVIGITVFVAANYIEGIEVDRMGAAMFMALILAVLNTLVRPVLVFLTLPISIMTLGLFLLVINTFLFWLSGAMVDGVHIDGIRPAFICALIITFITWMINMVLDSKKINR